jgi:hypothetical protein
MNKVYDMRYIFFNSNLLKKIFKQWFKENMQLFDIIKNNNDMNYVWNFFYLILREKYSKNSKYF